jgi:membrane-bound serine protease (ClpP class)
MSVWRSYLSIPLFMGSLLFAFSAETLSDTSAPVPVVTTAAEVEPIAESAVVPIAEPAVVPIAEPAVVPILESAAAPNSESVVEGGLVSVYVIPITDAIDKANLYILRRGLKDAIANNVGMIILNMDTPGGRVDYTLEMMEMLARFEGLTATYVNDDAISAGSFIAAATQKIYFSPQGKIGASAVIQGGGEDVPETAGMKIESYLRANIRSITEGIPYRADVIRAMLDADFELKIGDEVIKPAGELLTLTASEAMRLYGEPAIPLLGSGIYDSLDALLDARFGAGQYVIRDFEITYSEAIAKWMNAIAPALMGLGLLLLFLEFKTPGFGIFGILGITCLGIFFASQYIAGLAGHEPILFFVLGVILVLVEVLFFPGVLVFGIPGLICILGSLLWAMVDFWPGEGIPFKPTAWVNPMVNLVFGITLAMLGTIVFSRFFPGSWMQRKMVLESVAGGHGEVVRAERDSGLPPLGAEGIAVTDLFPSGRIEIEGRRFEARSVLGPIAHAAKVRVVQRSDFGLVVEEIQA